MRKSFDILCTAALPFPLALVLLYLLMPELAADRLIHWLWAAPVLTLLMGLCWSSREGWRLTGCCVALLLDLWFVRAIESAHSAGKSFFYAGTYAFGPYAPPPGAIDLRLFAAAMIGAALAGTAALLFVLRRPDWVRRIRAFVRMTWFFERSFAERVEKIRLAVFAGSAFACLTYGFVGMVYWGSPGRGVAFFTGLVCYGFTARLHFSITRWRRLIALALELPSSFFFTMTAVSMYNFYVGSGSLLHQFRWHWGYNPSSWTAYGWWAAATALGLVGFIGGAWLLRAELLWDRWAMEAAQRDLRQRRDRFNDPVTVPAKPTGADEMDAPAGWDRAAGGDASRHP